MLFTSPIFLFCFLPLLLVAARFAAVAGPSRIVLLLLAFSVIFYASWNPEACLLLAAVICVNYGFALRLSTVDPPLPPYERRLTLMLAIILNLIPLLWFKYSGFFVESLTFLLGSTMSFESPMLPVGISFYTFIQIAWLVSVYRGTVKPEGLTRHALFSGFFPYILSGPIVRYEQLGTQFDCLEGPRAETLSTGFALFIVGMAKKLLLADTLAVQANAVFGAAEKSWPITGAEAWLGSLSYSFQLYFDFSGYTDMAIGLGLMLGLQLPENFISPYKATGIVDFWRRWHITLGLWLRDFLYIPLGGNRVGKVKQYRNLFLTMLIGGAWHGAGWTFIIWGALHGFMLCVNHFFRAQIKDTKVQSMVNQLPCRIFFIALTFLLLHLCWIVFRSPNLTCLINMFTALFLTPLQAQGEYGTVSGLLAHHYFTDWIGLAWIGLSALIVWGLPCSHEIFCQRQEARKTWLVFRRTKLWACGLGLLFVCSLLMLTRRASFLYFQF